MIKKVKINNDVDYYQQKEISHSFIKMATNMPEIVKYLDAINSEEEGYEATGSMIHMQILEPRKYQETFIPFTGKKPSSKQQEDFAQQIAMGIDEEQAYDTAYSGKPRKDAISKLKTELADYIELIQNNKDKTIISESQTNMINEINESLIRDKYAKHLLFEIEGYNEQNLFGEYKKEKVKAKIDRFAIDRKNKKIYVIDIKTMSIRSKYVNINEEIKRRVDEMGYRTQIAFYQMFIESYYSNLIKEGYKVIPIIIFMTVNIPFAIRVFEIKTDEAKKEILRKLDDVLIHQKNGYDHSIEYYTQEGIPIIK